ncbi:MAG: hypothetical protein R2741_10260 [Methanolobus sp.]
MRDEFEIHGNDIAVRIANIDTMVGSGKKQDQKPGKYNTRFPCPSRIAGKTYSVEFSDRDIIFISDGRDETRVKVPYYTENTVVVPTTLYSPKAEYIVMYDPGTDAIVIY